MKIISVPSVDATILKNNVVGSIQTLRDVAFYTSNDNVTGSIIIKLPFFYNDTVCRLHLKGISNVDSQPYSADVTMVGYLNSTASSWDDCTSYSSANGIPFDNIQYGDDGINCFIILDSITTVWQYINLSLDSMIDGPGTPYEGYEITISDTLPINFVNKNNSNPNAGGLSLQLPIRSSNDLSDVITGEIVYISDLDMVAFGSSDLVNKLSALATMSYVVETATQLSNNTRDIASQALQDHVDHDYAMFNQLFSLMNDKTLRLQDQIDTLAQSISNKVLDNDHPIDIETLSSTDTGWIVPDELGGKITGKGGSYLLVGTGVVSVNDVEVYNNEGIPLSIGAPVLSEIVSFDDVIKSSNMIELTYTPYIPQPTTSQ